MSLLSALYTGVSGLQTFGDALQVTGDNIANVNTTAYKASRAEFSDVLSQSINVSSGRSQMGRGVTLEAITTNFAQGSFSSTDRMSDLAINGNGYFIVKDDTGAQYYTRNGEFTINNEGNLVTSGGLELVGYPYDNNGNIMTTLQSLQIQQRSTNPNATENVDLRLNLNASDDTHATFDVTDPASTSNFSTTTTVYDELGVAHEVAVYFNKTGTNSWDWHALVDGAELNGGTSGQYSECATGTMTFTGTGTMTSATTTTSSFNFSGTSTAQTINFNFDSATTQYSSANEVQAQSQDGYAAGSLSEVSITEDGTINGTYSNGQTLPIGQIALANFANLQGLQKQGAGIYKATLESGECLVGEAGSGSFGEITSFSLELSNVDLATEFVSLISTQRAYEASSKIITIGDELLSEVVNLIR